MENINDKSKPLTYIGITMTLQIFFFNIIFFNLDLVFFLVCFSAYAITASFPPFSERSWSQEANYVVIIEMGL